ncbi:hypothetical protein K2173_022741 [Erythroxylum novogranatense]|uniref:GTD-binding domain-containing protein n=1 Tax=Erythroxylum novogranatense TaxID=1862640 RepID=A0AAV8SN84_9ROSI|nr:hypothetical protein K2173_022741 [Erythroxylum novogranatense]
MAKRSFKSFVEQELGKFPLFVIYALLEWVLIFVLFVDGFLAFFANEFARFFELRIPCLLCTRIDHVLVHRDPDFYYNDSICENHKKDVGRLAFCYNHKKLSDIRNLCEGCLLSFATERESDTETYKSLIGILHKDIELLVEDDQEIQLTFPTGKKNEKVESSLHRCVCCGKPLKVKSHMRGKNSVGLSHAPAPSPRAPFGSSRNEDHRSMDLSHIRCRELKFPEHEEVHEDQEDGPSTAHAGKQSREDVKAASVPLLTEGEDMTGERTPIFARGNRFFGIPLTDSANASPRWAHRIIRKSPLEKTEFASESADGSMPNDVDSDSILLHLKGQVRLDRKSLMDLYMELDEERSASAIAANNAMAMITRLQAEKAAVQMEALQYQRMMEEQAEYDQEALQATHDLLKKREEEIKVLEAELEAYRCKFGELSEDERDEDYHQEFKSQSYLSYTEISNCISPTYSSTEGQNNVENVPNDDQSSSLHEQKGEEKESKSHHILQAAKSRQLGRLKNLDKRNQLPTDDGAPSSQSSSEIFYHVEEESVLTEISDNLQNLHRIIITPNDGA